jgi:hypothetical protein
MIGSDENIEWPCYDISDAYRPKVSLNGIWMQHKSGDSVTL